MRSTSLPPDIDHERTRIAAWLSFISERDRDLEIYLIHPSGQGERRLTRRVGRDYNGPASSDGKQLLIMRADETAAGTQQSLHVLTLADQSVRPLGPPRAVVRHPQWSADGQLIVFEGNSSNYRDLFSIKRDGSGLRQLTNNREGNFELALNTAGDALVFVSSRDRVAELYRANLDGSKPQRLTRTERDEWSPRWSADGNMLVFASDRDNADRLYLSRADGTQVRRVSTADLDTALLESSPCFSPRGLLLAYVSRRRGGNGALLVLDVSTGARHKVVVDDAADLGEPTWSPDGNYLAFTARKGADIQIYLARHDGSAVTRVTSASGPNWNPQWVPVPPKVQ